MNHLWSDPLQFWNLLFMAGSLGGLLALLMVQVLGWYLERRQARKDGY